MTASTGNKTDISREIKPVRNYTTLETKKRKHVILFDVPLDKHCVNLEGPSIHLVCKNNTKTDIYGQPRHIYTARVTASFINCKYRSD